MMLKLHASSSTLTASVPRVSGRAHAPSCAPARSHQLSHPRAVRLVAMSSMQDEQQGYYSEQAQQAVYEMGRKLQPWLESPFNLLSFGPRAGTGALLSLPTRLQTLEYDIQRARELAQDPRPLEDKQRELMKELEDLVVEFLERGATIEQDVLANIKAVLPEQAANLLTELIPEPPLRQSQPQASSSVEPMTYQGTTTSNFSQDDVKAEQVASEISEIRNAVSSLKASLEAMRTNTEPADAKILMLNLKEARDQLQRRLGEIAPATASDPSISAAEREARILLNEVDAMFFS